MSARLIRHWPSLEAISLEIPEYPCQSREAQLRKRSSGPPFLRVDQRLVPPTSMPPWIHAQATPQQKQQHQAYELVDYATKCLRFWPKATELVHLKRNTLRSLSPP